MANNRDNMTRCKICKQLFPDPENPTADEQIHGFQCPNGCKPSFEQPIYESPLQADETVNH